MGKNINSSDIGNTFYILKSSWSWLGREKNREIEQVVRTSNLLSRTHSWYSRYEWSRYWSSWNCIGKKTRLSANIALITTAISSINTKNSQSYTFNWFLASFFFFALWKRKITNLYCWLTASTYIFDLELYAWVLINW